MDTSYVKLREIVLAKFDDHCAYCGCELNMYSLTIDHVKPKERGMDNAYHGDSVIDNWFPACKPCNSSKNAMSLDRWRYEIQCKVEKLKESSATFRMAFKFGLIEETNSEVIFYFEKVKQRDTCNRY